MHEINTNRIISSLPLNPHGDNLVYPYEQDNKNQEEVVIKHKLIKTAGKVSQAIQEVVLAYNCKHSSIVPILGYSLEPRLPAFDLYIKMPRMKENLETLINRRRSNGFNLEEVISYFYPIIEGLEYLHKNKIIHRKINFSNILVHEDGSLKISDLSSAILADQIPINSQLPISENYISQVPPEILNNTSARRYKYSMDVWSLGAVMLDFCLLKSTTQPRMNEEQLKQLNRDILEIKIRYNNDLGEIIGQMLSADETKRPSIKEVREAFETKFKTALAKKGLIKKKGFQMVDKDVQVPSPQEKKDQTNYNEEGVISNIIQGGAREEKKDPNQERKKSGNTAQNRRKVVKELQAKWSCYFDILNEMKTLEIYNEDKEGKLTDEIVMEFFEELATKTKGDDVEKFSNIVIDFKRCSELTCRGLKFLGETISLNFGSINRFSLVLDKLPRLPRNKIKDEGLKGLIISLGNLAKLISLSLSFNYCDEITDSGVIEFGNIIGAEFRGLEELKLSFIGCTKVTTKGIGSLAENINKNLNQLEHLTISCYHIKDDEFKRSLQKKFDWIKKTLIDFNNHDNISYPGNLKIANS